MSCCQTSEMTQPITLSKRTERQVNEPHQGYKVPVMAYNESLWLLIQQKSFSGDMWSGKSKGKLKKKHVVFNMIEGVRETDEVELDGLM